MVWGVFATIFGASLQQRNGQVPESPVTFYLVFNLYSSTLVSQTLQFPQERWYIRFVLLYTWIYEYAKSRGPYNPARITVKGSGDGYEPQA